MTPDPMKLESFAYDEVFSNGVALMFFRGGRPDFMIDRDEWPAWQAMVMHHTASAGRKMALNDALRALRWHDDIDSVRVDAPDEVAAPAQSAASLTRTRADRALRLLLNRVSQDEKIGDLLEGHLANADRHGDAFANWWLLRHSVSVVLEQVPGRYRVAIGLAVGTAVARALFG